MPAGGAAARLATLIGAVGAHALRPRLTADRYEVLQTAVQYQFFHALGLLALGLLLDRCRGAGCTRPPGCCSRAVLLFSGSLYLILAGAPRLIGVLTPVGGLVLIIGWCMAAMALGGDTIAGDNA